MAGVDGVGEIYRAHFDFDHISLLHNIIILSIRCFVHFDQYVVERGIMSQFDSPEM